MKFTGQLAKVNLANLLQLVENGELTGKITLDKEAKIAQIFVEEGNVIHAQIDRKIGTEALKELFLWQSGSFSFNEENVQGIKQTLNLSWEQDSIENLLKEDIVPKEEEQQASNAIKETNDQIELPNWAIARLRQDNSDLSKAIVDMVIWVDRIKCWLYQADADFDRLITELNSATSSINVAKDKDSK